MVPRAPNRAPISLLPSGPGEVQGVLSHGGPVLILHGEGSSSLVKLLVKQLGMAKITLSGDPVSTVGDLPALGSKAPEFTLVQQDLSEISKADIPEGKIILNIFPSVDTGICAMSVRRFNQMAADLDDTTVVCASKDLPFAFERFCGAEGIDGVITASAFRSSFGDDYGVEMADGALAGLLSRSVVVIDSDGDVVYTEQVPEIKQEPDYQAALDAVVALDS